VAVKLIGQSFLQRNLKTVPEIPMGKNSERTSDVQVFELTMDNDENQDELNRRLCKPGEPECSDSIKPVKLANSAPADTEAKKTRQEPC
jgi:hypothetical protein